MKKIQNLSSESRQQLSINLDDGSSVTFVFRYAAFTQAWMLSVVYKGQTFVKSLRMTVHPNYLRSWRRVIPFGLSVSAQDGVDPVQQDDFESGRVEMNLLSQDEVAYVESSIIGKPS